MSNKIVTRDEWLKARQKLLKKEKEFTRKRDALSKRRQELPWIKIKKEYTFQGPNGSESLIELFDGQSQLVIYHFMFGPDWEVGCKSCSFWADNFQNLSEHLAHRDVNFLLVSRTSIDKIEQFKKRMGWTTKWISSLDSDFNYDFNVTFDKKELENQKAFYNYRFGTFPAEEAPGASVFIKVDEDIFHTYSTFGRGLDMLNTAYHILDIVPKGRDENNLPYTMDWLRYRDSY
jgi:predicted dithiol-disulfide oxidoreductase (DUF899 family)